MDFFQLKCFISVIDQKSFTEAAYENAVSQSSLSKQISKLEDELGATLIDRSHRLAALTPAGREFEPYARRMVNEERQALAALKRFSDSGSLHIGCVDHMGRVGLTAPISGFLDQYPGGSVSINMERGSTNSLMESLLKGQLDMAIIAHIVSPISHKSNLDGYDLSEYHTYTLVRDEYHAVVNEKHPFAVVQGVADNISYRLTFTRPRRTVKNESLAEFGRFYRFPLRRVRPYRHKHFGGRRFVFGFFRRFVFFFGQRLIRKHSRHEFIL